MVVWGLHLSRNKKNEEIDGEKKNLKKIVRQSAIETKALFLSSSDWIGRSKRPVQDPARFGVTRDVQMPRLYVPSCGPSPCFSLQFEQRLWSWDCENVGELQFPFAGVF
jgi:hypothetical protein